MPRKSGRLHTAPRRTAATVCLFRPTDPVSWVAEFGFGFGLSQEPPRSEAVQALGRQALRRDRIRWPRLLQRACGPFVLLDKKRDSSCQ